MEDLGVVLNSPGLWIASSVMVIVILFQALFFMRAAWREGEKINFPRAERIKAMRAAAITSIGPSLAPVIILMALIAVLGAPTAWMRLNDIGASRTELAVATMTAKFAGAVPGGEGWNLNAFSYSMWGMALNNLMWMLVALIFTPRMSGMVMALNRKYNPRVIKMVMAGAAFGLFGILLAAQTVKTNSGKVYSAVFAAAAMYLLVNFVVKKVPWVREPALGLAMLVGMFVAAALV